jgi:predicted kinase
MTKPKLYVLVGVPGSGKSTWVSNQKWANDCAYISTDKHVDDYAATVNKTYNDVFHDYMPTAVKLMTADVIVARETNKDIIWDQTSTSIKSRKKKFVMLPGYEYIAVVFPTPDPEEHARRLSGRNGKHIPKKVLRQMISSFQMPTTDEGFDEIWIT